MIILGVNAFHADSSACLVVDGKLVAAAEEERFCRIKHWAGLPKESIRYCLEVGGIALTEVDHIAINRDPRANALKKILYTLVYRPNFVSLVDRLKNATKVRGLRDEIALSLGVPPNAVNCGVDNIEHHFAHLASAFFVSPFREAAVVSVDGFGDFASMLWGIGRDNQIQIKDRVNFPHSLGLFYLAITQYLGFPNFGDEYKVMGLAPYGQPTELGKMRNIVRLLSQGSFELDLTYFLHHSEGVSMVWENGEPHIEEVFSPALEALLGPKRRKGQKLEDRYLNIAASAQAMYEEVFFHLLNYVKQVSGLSALALAGGCAMNSVANGKILQFTEFKDLYVQSAAGDAGGAIGAAFAVWNQKLGQPRGFEMEHAYWGPEFSNKQLQDILQSNIEEIEKQSCRIIHVVNDSELSRLTANAISQGKVVGWFQGRMEWGPRALGNRSILGDPRRPDMKDILNLKIKRRESFRPFAPSIMREFVQDWFETDYDVPFMLQVFQIIEAQRIKIPSVTHVNGSGRLQTVTKEQNAKYYELIKDFYKITGVPILLNTSFNENEPIVCRPDEALNCFLRTQMDVLVLGNFFIERQALN